MRGNSAENGAEKFKIYEVVYTLIWMVPSWIAKIKNFFVLFYSLLYFLHISLLQLPAANCTFPDIRALCSCTAESKAMKATTAELLPKTSDAATDQDILLWLIWDWYRIHC